MNILNKNGSLVVTHSSGGKSIQKILKTASNYWADPDNNDIIDFEASTTFKTVGDDISFVGGGISAAADGANITITTGGTTDGDVTLTAITVHSLEVYQKNIVLS